MTLRERLAASPMTWKDYLGAAGTLMSIGTVLVMGGRILEQAERTRADVAMLSGEVSKMRTTMAEQQVMLERQAGADRVHEEQIASLRREIELRKGGRP